MSHTTQGTLLLDRLGIAYTLHPYDYDPDAPRIGLHAAESLDIDPARQEEVERRLAAIEELSRKHRVPPAELPARAAVLERELAMLSPRLPADGVLWVSWPKKASGIASDISEDGVRALALPIGLVDVKVCAIDATWSGLKLVWRRELRAGKRPSPL